MSDDEFNHKMAQLDDMMCEAAFYDDCEMARKIEKWETELLVQYNTEVIDDWNRRWGTGDAV